MIGSVRRLSRKQSAKIPYCVSTSNGSACVISGNSPLASYPRPLRFGIEASKTGSVPFYYLSLRGGAEAISSFTVGKIASSLTLLAMTLDPFVFARSVSDPAVISSIYSILKFLSDPLSQKSIIYHINYKLSQHYI